MFQLRLTFTPAANDCFERQFFDYAKTRKKINESWFPCKLKRFNSKRREKTHTNLDCEQRWPNYLYSQQLIWLNILRTRAVPQIKLSGERGIHMERTGRSERMMRHQNECTSSISNHIISLSYYLTTRQLQSFERLQAAFFPFYCSPSHELNFDLRRHLNWKSALVMLHHFVW